MADQVTLSARELIGGVAEGELLYSDTGLSFWGGVDPVTGVVIDHTHPLKGQCVSGKVLAIPNGRGSCTGSQVVLELLLNGRAPAALALRTPDVILALGVVVAEELFGLSLPVVALGEAGFAALAGREYAAVAGATARAGDKRALCDSGDEPKSPRPTPPRYSSADDLLAASPLVLRADERAALAGERGAAARVAMRVVARAAAAYGARELVHVRRVHVDACTYIGPGGLKFVQELARLGGRVAVPTTLNSGSVDRRRWRRMGVPADAGAAAEAVGDAYVQIGCEPESFTCAPYAIEAFAPAFGEHVAWGESNAVVFANSVLGARTLKWACAAQDALCLFCDDF